MQTTTTRLKTTFYSQGYALKIIFLLRFLVLSFQALLAYKLRSLFVILAISLGIASLTIIIASIDGANKKADEISNVFGPDALMVFGGDILAQSSGKRTLTLTWEDAKVMRASLPSAYIVLPMRAKSQVLLRYQNNSFTTNIVVGSTENYATAWNWPLAEGRDFTAEDVEKGASVCLLAHLPATKLFGNANPVGKNILLNGVPFTVIGILSFRGLSTPGGGEIDDRVIIPLTTLTKRFNMDKLYFRALRVKFLDSENMEYNKEQVASLLRKLHKIEDGGSDDFSIITAMDIQKFLNMLKGGLVIFLGITAAAAMSVGGFVLANLFYLSVAERKVEIGLKKALGATSRDILIQFMFESVLLTLLGAVLGLVIGLFFGQILTSLGLIEIALSFKVFLLALLASVLIGLIFGLRPAKEAARLDPILALKGGD
ncbi:ABC transporter permease [Desulfovibrio litoralis]|uniref:Putative ABC transport system permease protein n=1 Tax=Desulfovibrio litoralis DSM 11393 TaxID=1121455 RepID=A0A1M7RQS7_9BACT|nr:ABC transporter permease [Desulfovibrio litoralis]SHN48717.1 putative ABC transport system permease protein [Desulfovibrio litoralis DSM 11393]